MDYVLLVGGSTRMPMVSRMLREVSGKEEGAPPPVDLDEERENGNFVRGLINDGIVTAAHDIVNPNANKCLDATGNSSANGTRLQIWTCAGTANQKWTTP